MKVLVISDVHGNLPALEYVLKSESSAELVISLGDVVNYGPWSNECVDLLETVNNKVLLKGNHEDAFIAGKYAGVNEIAKTFFNFCFPSFNRLNIIKTYEDTYVLDNFDCVHTLNDMYIFPDTEIEIKKNTFIGHSHRQFLKVIRGYTLANAGSVGQNRVNIDQLNYILWDSVSQKIDLVTKEFKSDTLLNEMRFRKYPKICIDYIQSKRK